MGWLAKLSKKAEKPAAEPAVDLSTPTVDELSRGIPEFGRLIEADAAYGRAIFDVQTLPLAKQRLELILICAVAITEDDQQAEQVAAGMISLADYQQGVGPESIAMMPPLSTPGLNLNEAGLRARAGVIASDSSTPGYTEFLPLVAADQIRLKRLTQKGLTTRAARLAERGQR